MVSSSQYFFRYINKPWQSLHDKVLEFGVRAININSILNAIMKQHFHAIIFTAKIQSIKCHCADIIKMLKSTYRNNELIMPNLCVLLETLITASRWNYGCSMFNLHAISVKFDRQTARVQRNSLYDAFTLNSCKMIIAR